MFYEYFINSLYTFYASARGIEVGMGQERSWSRSGLKRNPFGRLRVLLIARRGDISYILWLTYLSSLEELSIGRDR